MRAGRRFRTLVMLAVGAVLLLGSYIRPASAQADPRQILAGVIQQFQTGAVNQQWYGAEAWQTIAAQTNNTGRYQALIQLGPVVNIAVTQQQQLPAGPVYTMMAQHQNGASMWQLGISTYTNRIEYYNFNISAAQQPSAPSMPTTPMPSAPAPTTPMPSTPMPSVPTATPTAPAPVPSATPPGGGGSNSDACKKFPNLC